MPIVRDSGSHTVSALATEELVAAADLPDNYDGGLFVFVIDLDNMVAGDAITVREYGNGNIEGPVLYRTSPLSGVDGGKSGVPLWITLPARPYQGVLNTKGFQYTIEQDSGSLLTIEWSLEELGRRPLPSV